MRLGRAKFAACLLCLSLVCTAPQGLAKKKDKTASNPSDPRRALHALNRLTFGPRPDDLQQVMATGVEQWIELQLHPEKIDDSALNARLEPLRTVRMSTREIVAEFPDPQEIRQVMEGKKSLPSDPAKRAIYQVQIARLQDRKDRKEESEKNPVAGTPEKSNSARVDGSAMAAAAPPGKLTPEEEQQARTLEEELYADLEVQQLPSLSPEQRFKKVLGMPVAQQVAFADSLRGGKGLGSCCTSRSA